MKKITSVIVFLMLSSLILAQETTNVVQVTVDGLAYMGDTDTMQAAKERAMKDAERKAIEQGTGLYIESYSKVHNYMTVEDEIKSMATGYITSKKVLIDAMETDPPRYHVQIEAQVKCGDLGQLMADKKEEEKPQAKSTSYTYQVNFEAKAGDGKWQQKEIMDGDVVHMGDRLQLQMRPANTCNLIVVFESGKGRIKRLFPANDQAVSKVQAGEAVQAPADQPWLVFNEADIGNVTLFQFASQKNLAQLNWLLERAANADTEANALAFKKFIASLQKRQPAARRAPLVKRTGRRAARISETVAGSGVLMKALRLQVQP